MPGPTLTVYRGSRVIVHVTNGLDIPISLHFHGADQRGSFFMDGVGSVTQCPIMTDETFTHDFVVGGDPAIDPYGN